ncbi:MAG: glycoside hydrolase family 3 N-terminal domain-containing protein [Verrucomicrobiota bacterium]
MDVSQLLLIGVPGAELDTETADRLHQLQPGGFILFGRNIESPEQVRKLIDGLRELSEIEPVITIDQEGGRVSRLRLIGKEPPNAQQLRENGDLDLISRHGKLTGQLLRLFGFNLDLCPVLDISWNGDEDNSLRGRTWGLDANEVISNAAFFNGAMRHEGILSCGKHFPGYSRAAVDAHHELPVIDRTREELEAEELAPFRAMLPDLDSIMVCHSHYPSFDPERNRWPASLSENVINGYLRGQLGYEDGLVMTDDLDMGAILNEVTFKDTIQSAVKAGNDMVMICHRLDLGEEAVSHLGGLSDGVLEDATVRLEKFKLRLAGPRLWSMDEFQRINNEIWQLRVDTLGEEGALRLSEEDGKRSPVELY